MGGDGSGAGPGAGPPPVFGPARLGPLTLKNRIIKSATFEGASPRGVVSDELVAFHERVARGGAAMTTVAYLAVSPEGRTDRHCLLLDEATVPGLRRLTGAVHGLGALASAQIGHAGPVANSKSNRAPALSPSRRLGASGSLTHAVDGSDIGRITEDYRAAATRAVAAGFDCIEIHLGHNYLLSSFLSPKLNRRSDGWGGSLENRARFPRQVVAAVREGAGRGVAVTAKLNMVDGVDGGFDLPESVDVARMLEQDGHLDALELTGGSSLSNPMYLFRGDAPRAEFAATQPQPIRLGMQLVGRWFLKEYPFEEGYFRAPARRFLEVLDLPVILLGGVNRLDTVESALAEGFSFVAMARALLREPDLVARWELGVRDGGRCIHCNRCMPSIYSGTFCVEAGPRPVG
jgi:2,4-dienoyl-CoA reductase-like NADH-dependent reductase (Old Yellow Enzyme family)